MRGFGLTRRAAGEARNSSGARRSARTSGGWPSCCERRAHAGAVGARPGERERAGERLAPVREGGGDEARSAAARPAIAAAARAGAGRRRISTSTESTFGTG